MGRSDKRRPDQRNVDSRAEHGVVTVTLNPALDVSMSIDLLVPDRKLRAHDVRREAGGGGVYVSRVLRRLGVPNISFVVTGGGIGDELLMLMRHEGLAVIGFTIDGTTRESVAITETNTARQYRVSVPGPNVDRPDELQRILREIGATASIVVFSGSVPHCRATSTPDCWMASIRMSPRSSTLLAPRWPPSSAAPLEARTW